jgi:hypothetical protein
MSETAKPSRAQLVATFEQEFHSSLDAQVERYLEAAHHQIVADSAFASASSGVTPMRSTLRAGPQRHRGGCRGPEGHRGRF